MSSWDLTWVASVTAGATSLDAIGSTEDNFTGDDGRKRLGLSYRFKIGMITRINTKSAGAFEQRPGHPRFPFWVLPNPSASPY